MIKDSRKRWAVLYLDANNQVMIGATDYYWTRRAANRRARMIGGSSMWTAKVVPNRGG